MTSFRYENSPFSGKPLKKRKKSFLINDILGINTEKPKNSFQESRIESQESRGLNRVSESEEFSLGEKKEYTTLENCSRYVNRHDAAHVPGEISSNSKFVEKLWQNDGLCDETRLKRNGRQSEHFDFTLCEESINKHYNEARTDHADRSSFINHVNYPKETVEIPKLYQYRDYMTSQNTMMTSSPLKFSVPTVMCNNNMTNAIPTTISPLATAMTSQPILPSPMMTSYGATSGPPLYRHYVSGDVMNFPPRHPSFGGEGYLTYNPHTQTSHHHYPEPDPRYYWSPYLQQRQSSKRKGGQVRFTNEQTVQLENKFDRQKYLSPDERKAMAKLLHLSGKQVKTWFQNRRAKWRRLKQESSPDDTLTSDDETQSPRLPDTSSAADDDVITSPYIDVTNNISSLREYDVTSGDTKVVRQAHKL